ncbi:lipoyl(octanoyl) transferase LipB [Desulfovibrio ferrophilus]|uniref:Octanoyltransferase n=1 Tax=Desulfovibrio ferrophilus TaxID=241368 RepID=A0A2Z6AV90_9BACT|nr:lipoyl(octanoyl) transferase LipB [Desulfovibrio ferrophilus]BBD07147.1 lipoate-protein ligase B [Desulfovibrio ferrophilus]
MKIIDLGLCPYREAQQIQLDRHAEVVEGAEDTLFLLEHPRVITVGKAGGLENLHVQPEFLEQQGIDLVHVTRGGNITCHFPGQLVGYPIFRVDKRPGGVKRFFHDMEETVIRTLGCIGLDARRWEGRAGVWTETGKVCSMGIAVKKWVTYHGLALNVGEDTSLFDMITLCGLTDTKAASVHGELKALGHEERPGMQEIKDVLEQEFRKVFADSKVA